MCIARRRQVSVVGGQRPVRDAGIDVMGQVKTDAVGHKEESRQTSLTHAVSTDASVGTSLHTTVFGNRSETIDDSPHRHVWQ